MGLFSSFTKSNSNVNWIPLTEASQLETIKTESMGQTVVIFKHSTRCSISLMAKNRLDTKWEGTDEDAKMYYLDLLKFRPISDLIAREFGVIHESPQVLVIKNGACDYTASHSTIEPRTLKRAL